MRALCLFTVVTLGTPQLLSAGEDMKKLMDALSGRWVIAQQNTDGTARGEEAWYAALVARL